MKVRPIFWYGLIAALALALIVKTGENFNQMEQLNKFGSLGGIMKMLPTNLMGNINEEKIDGIEGSIKK